MTVPSFLGWSEELMAHWDALADELRRRLGPGTPLAPDQRQRMEGRLGYDLSAALVHAGPLPSQIASGAGAHALSVAGHVLGGGSRLDARSVQGEALLGHELTHAIRALGAVRGSGGTRSGGSQIQLLPAESAATGPSGEEAVAQAVEASLIQGKAAASSKSGGNIDLDRLTERLYQRVLDQLRDERERAAELG
jgi:hypothetical protein